MVLAFIFVACKVTLAELIMYDIDTWSNCNIYQSEITLIQCGDYFELYETATLWEKSVTDIQSDNIDDEDSVTYYKEEVTISNVQKTM